jgi:23S rRNA U2552 (ribose-2'-O)-methylase RlmE/FtsJ
MKVCDVASAPGSFLQVLRKTVWNDWIIVWIDLQKIEKF